MKKMKYVLSVLALFVILVACSINEPDIDTEPTITIGVMMALDSVPIFVAEELGFFADENLQVHIERFSSASDRDTAFQASDHMGAITFDLIALSMYNEAGFDMATVSNTLGLATLVGVPGMERMEDLRGQTVLIAHNTAMDYVLHTALRQAGMTFDDIVAEGVPSLPTRLEMLRNGHAQAAALPEPFTTIALDEGFYPITNTRALNINPFVIAFRRSVTEAHPDEVRAFFRALNRAVDFLNSADREEFIDILIDIAGFPAHTRDTLTLPVFPSFDTPNPAFIEDAFAFARYRELLTLPLTAQDVIFDAFGD